MCLEMGSEARVLRLATESITRQGRCTVSRESTSEYSWIDRGIHTEIFLQAKKDVHALFATLPPTEQESLLGLKASTKHKPLAHGNSNDAASARSVSPSPKPQEAKLNPGENENDDSRSGKPGRPKKEKVVDPEKAAKVTLVYGRRIALTNFTDPCVA